MRSEEREGRNVGRVPYTNTSRSRKMIDSIVLSGHDVAAERLDDPHQQESERGTGDARNPPRQSPSPSSFVFLTCINEKKKKERKNR